MTITNSLRVDVMTVWLCIYNLIWGKFNGVLQVILSILAVLPLIFSAVIAQKLQLIFKEHLIALKICLQEYMCKVFKTMLTTTMSLIAKKLVLNQEHIPFISMSKKMSKNTVKALVLKVYSQKLLLPSLSISSQQWYSLNTLMSGCLDQTLIILLLIHWQ